MMLDSLAERYGQLPSQVLEYGSTFDLWVFDVSMGYRNMLEKRERAKTDPSLAISEAASPELIKKWEKYNADKDRSRSKRV